MGTLDWGSEYSRTKVEHTNGAPIFQVSEEFRAALQRARSSSVSATCRADYRLAVGYFLTGTDDKGPNLPAILFRLENAVSQEALVEFKDKFKKKLLEEFEEKPTAVFPPKVLVAVAQPKGTDKPEIHANVKVRKVDAAWELLEFESRGAPIPREPPP
ncbi:hypothetical protein PG984_005235 [Apiospora sp. TS-2023a]